MRRSGTARKAPPQVARDWLNRMDDYVPRQWAPHLYGVSRQCIQKAINSGRVEIRELEAPDGTPLELLRMADLEKLRSRDAA